MSAPQFMQQLAADAGQGESAPPRERVRTRGFARKHKRDELTRMSRVIKEIIQNVEDRGAHAVNVGAIREYDLRAGKRMCTEAALPGLEKRMADAGGADLSLKDRVLIDYVRDNRTTLRVGLEYVIPKVAELLNKSQRS
jgi:hypothetical protein